MKYTVQFENAMSDSAFIYFKAPPHLCICYLQIITNHDEELKSKEKDYSFRFGDLDFKIRHNTDVLNADEEPLKSKGIEKTIEEIEKERKELGWNCIMADNVDGLDDVINAHLHSYKQGIYQRMRPEEFFE